MNFTFIKEKLSLALILALPNFRKLFEMDCNAWGAGIGTILSLEGRLVEFFSSKIE